jgi:hypothetical protein
VPVLHNHSLLHTQKILFASVHQEGDKSVFSVTEVVFLLHSMLGWRVFSKLSTPSLFLFFKAMIYIVVCFRGNKMSDYVMVAAIDFGTTYSGYAFSTISNLKLDPLKIHANQAWNNDITITLTFD